MNTNVYLRQLILSSFQSWQNTPIVIDDYVLSEIPAAYLCAIGYELRHKAAKDRPVIRAYFHTGEYPDVITHHFLASSEIGGVVVMLGYLSRRFGELVATTKEYIPDTLPHLPHSTYMLSKTIQGDRIHLIKDQTLWYSRHTDAAVELHLLDRSTGVEIVTELNQPNSRSADLKVDSINRSLYSVSLARDRDPIKIYSRTLPAVSTTSPFKRIVRQSNSWSIKHASMYPHVTASYYDVEQRVGVMFAEYRDPTLNPDNPLASYLGYHTVRLIDGQILCDNIRPVRMLSDRDTPIEIWDGHNTDQDYLADIHVDSESKVMYLKTIGTDDNSPYVRLQLLTLHIGDLTQDEQIYAAAVPRAIANRELYPELRTYVYSDLTVTPASTDTDLEFLVMYNYWFPCKLSSFTWSWYRTDSRGQGADGDINYDHVAPLAGYTLAQPKDINDSYATDTSALVFSTRTRASRSPRTRILYRTELNPNSGNLIYRSECPEGDIIVDNVSNCIVSPEAETMVLFRNNHIEIYDWVPASIKE